jgi:beta-RFAP synthase
MSEAAAKYARRAHQAYGRSGEPAVEIEVVHAPPAHVGLGTGTQLALSIAAGIAALAGEAVPSGDRLAQITRRGRRSAVGTYGFEHGGLIVEAGKTQPDANSPLIARLAIPEKWRFVLIRPRGEEGLSGMEESGAFERLPATPLATTDALCREALLHLVPAVHEGRCEEAAESLYRFGHLAGSCFAAHQGGPYATAELEAVVAWLREQGVRGVAQSSWGPLLFAMVRSPADADRCVQLLRERPDGDQFELSIASPCNAGARIEVD